MVMRMKERVAVGRLTDGSSAICGWNFARPAEWSAEKRAIRYSKGLGMGAD